jgi:hypothetical protein
MCFVSVLYVIHTASLQTQAKITGLPIAKELKGSFLSVPLMYAGTRNRGFNAAVSHGCLEERHRLYVQTGSVSPVEL